MIFIAFITVVLSKKGWVYAAKGHNMNDRTLNYRSGDEFFDVGTRLY